MGYGNTSNGLPIRWEHESSEPREEEGHPLGNAFVNLETKISSKLVTG